MDSSPQLDLHTLLAVTRDKLLQSTILATELETLLMQEREKSQELEAKLKTLEDKNK